MENKFLFQKCKKGQFAIEFIVLLSVMFVVFITILGLVLGKVLDIKESERREVAKSIATLAQNEIELAKSVSDGYHRTFHLPNRVNGHSYNISTIDNAEMTIYYVDQEFLWFLPSGVFGNLTPGDNNITNRGGQVFINS